MEDVTIREAEDRDYDQLMKLYNFFVDDDRYDSKQEDSFSEVLQTGANYVYVAEDEEKKQLVGFAAFSVRRVIRYPKPIAELDELFIAPAYRRKQLGKKLVDTCLKKAAEIGCYRMFIETHYQHDIAHKLYEKMEFTNYGYHFIKDL